MAEVVVDVLNSALGTSEVFAPTLKPNQKTKINLPTIKPDIRAIELGTSLVQSPTAAYAFRIFGRPPRTSACDCERAMDPALPQNLSLMPDPNLISKISSPNGRLQQLLKSKLSDDEILDELFLATLSRRPTEADRKYFNEYRQAESDRRTVFTDTLWALINTREFILNH